MFYGRAESVLRLAYAQHDPLVEYRREGHRLFQELFDNFGSWIFLNLFRTINTGQSSTGTVTFNAAPLKGKELGGAGGTVSTAHGDKVGRNDPCPCGSGLKYKKCGLINAPEHKR